MAELDRSRDHWLALVTASRRRSSPMVGTHKYMRRTMLRYEDLLDLAERRIQTAIATRKISLAPPGPPNTALMCSYATTKAVRAAEPAREGTLAISL